METSPETPNVNRCRVGPHSGEPGAETNVRTIPTPLSAAETWMLARCEKVLQRGLATFFEVGDALLAIKERGLYRTTHPTFEQYCRERWGICRSYAWRVTQAAERVKLLPANDQIPRPKNEFQIRPFLKLEPKAFPGMWQEVIKRAHGGRVTPDLARALVVELSSSALSPKKESPIRVRTRPKACMGKVLVLLHEAKRRVEKGEKEQALEVLAEIENLLFA